MEKNVLKGLIQTFGCCNYLMNFMSKSNNSAINKILLMCLIILTLAKCTSPKVLAKMTFGRQSSDRNSLILENVLLDSLVLQDNLKPMVSTKDYMVHLFNYQKI